MNKSKVLVQIQAASELIMDYKTPLDTSTSQYFVEFYRCKKMFLFILRFCAAHNLLFENEIIKEINVKERSALNKQNRKTQLWPVKMNTANAVAVIGVLFHHIN